MSAGTGGAVALSGRDAETVDASDEFERGWFARIADVCEAAANGDLEQRVVGCDVGGDLQRVADAVNHLLDITDAFVREAGAALESAAHERFYRRVLLRGMPGSFRRASATINRASAQMAETAAIRAHERRRLELAREFDGTIDDVVAGVGAAAAANERTAASLTDYARTAAREASEATNEAVELANDVQTVASATEELAATASEVARRADASTAMVSKAVDEAKQAQATVQGLEDASTHIGRVLKLITQIAGQTKLLALNAAIEAARAGEAGKGFAVVASEVKTLAQQTATAAADISAKVGAIQSSSQNAAGAIAGIGRTIVQVSEMLHDIDLAIGEQRAATAEINRTTQRAANGTQALSANLGTVARVVGDTSQAAEQVHEESSRVSTEAARLRREADGFLSALRGR